MLAVPILRRDGWASAWIRKDRMAIRLAVGLGLALCASGLPSGVPVRADATSTNHAARYAVPEAVRLLRPEIRLAAKHAERVHPVPEETQHCRQKSE